MFSLLPTDAMQVHRCLLSNPLNEKVSKKITANKTISSYQIPLMDTILGNFNSTKSSKADFIGHFSTIDATVNNLQAVCTSGSRKQLTQNHF
jgi:hypothetical protein